MDFREAVASLGLSIALSVAVILTFMMFFRV